MLQRCPQGGVVPPAVGHCGTLGYTGHMSLPHEVNQRELKLHASEIMDAVERGETFTITRNGRRVATVTPIGPRPTFVSKERVSAAFSGAPVLDDRRFREDVRTLFEDEEYDPFERARDLRHD